VRRTITTVNNRPILGDVKSPASRRLIDLDPRTVAVLRRHQMAQKERRVMAGPGSESHRAGVHDAGRDRLEP